MAPGIYYYSGSSNRLRHAERLSRTEGWFMTEMFGARLQIPLPNFCYPLPCELD